MRDTARWLLLLFAVAVPWEYSLDLGEPLGNIARVLMLMLLPVAALAILQAGRARFPGVLQWLALTLFIIFCCSYFWSIDPEATMAKTRGYFQEMVTVWLVWEFAESPRDLRNLLRAYVAGCWILALLTIADLALGATAGQVRFAAEGHDPNDVARILDLGLPLAALLAICEPARAARTLAFGYLPVGTIGVLLTASRGGFLAALLALGGCVVVLIRGHARAWFAALLALPVGAGAVALAVPGETVTRLSTIPEQLSRGDLNQRMNIWDAGWRAFTHAPFLGTGAGTFVTAAGMAPIDTAHNTALSLLVEGGIVTLIVASGLMASCGASVMGTRGLVRIALVTELLVWTVTSMVATVEENRTTWLLVGLMAAAGRLATCDSEEMNRQFGAVGHAIPALAPGVA